MTQKTDDHRITKPEVVLETQPLYLNGFPKFVAVTFVNPPGTGCFPSLPQPVWIPDDAQPLSWEFTSNSKEKERLTYRGVSDDCETFELGDGERRRFIIDMSTCIPDLPEGDYTLVVHVLLRGAQTVASNASPCSFRHPTATDSLESERLRRMGNPLRPAGSWTEFLTDNWNTVSVDEKLSVDARKACAMHLFLHRAIYGPRPPADLPTDELDAFHGTVIRSLALLLHYEILYSRGMTADAEKCKKELLDAYPGCGADIRSVEKNEGVLTTGRKWYGMNRKFFVKPVFYPYTDKNQDNDSASDFRQ